MKKILVVMLWVGVICGVAGILFCIAAVSPNSVLAESAQQLDVYLLSGYNVRSYVQQHEDGRVVWDGVAWDYIALINPEIDRELVYIPESRANNHEPGHFFFIDSLERATGPIYRIKPGAKCFVEKDEFGFTVEEDREWKAPEEEVLVEPYVNPNGFNRVYLNQTLCPDSQKRFICRQELELLNPRPALSQGQ